MIRAPGRDNALIGRFIRLLKQTGPYKDPRKPPVPAGTMGVVFANSWFDDTGDPKILKVVFPGYPKRYDVRSNNAELVDAEIQQIPGFNDPEKG